MTNALICIGSPLQALCAVEAIAEYKVDKYKLYVIDDGTRLNQIKNYLDSKSLEYFVIPFHVPVWKNILRMIMCLNPIKGKYNYLFMGDYRLTGNRMEYVPLVKNDGKIIYLDDGTYIVSWSKGLLSETKLSKIRNVFLNAVCKLRGISHKNVFTMFAKDIMIDGYSVRENRFSQIQLLSAGMDETIYFVGTNPLGDSGYCTALGLDFKYYMSNLRKVLLDIKTQNPSSHIVYIPHGRDISLETIRLCEQLGVEYRKIQVCIELFVLSLKCCPKEIWGVGSTALYTLRKLCKETKVVNIIFRGSKSEAFQEYIEIADVFKRNGIENVLI